MKTTLFFLLAIILFETDIYAQDTFSIVAADSSTREVGSAGASCVNLFQFNITDPSFLGDLLPDTGAINTQASYLATNQTNARVRMRAGDSPAQNILWLSSNDAQNNPAVRQYGIVGFTGNNVSAEAYTGINCMDYKNHKTGSIDGFHYSIQGNILLGQDIIDSMEIKFRNAQGDLACRLMAALQGANVTGADTRCAPNGTSSLFAYVKVAKPTDAYGNPWFNVSVRTLSNAQIEPIDSLQTIFDLQHNCLSIGINKTTLMNHFNVYPNPSTKEIILRSDGFLIGSTYIISDILGKQVLTGIIAGENSTVDVGSLFEGLYIIQVSNLQGKTFLKL
ncbi:MAG: DUF1028 domain-containing protein [Bacteroidetes bacterium]|nr:DUF1028 domain-containing protein [Bacteroidota bacterium]HET6244534.1 DUF1028 domain-containing protein [Bacteroidia bacterium]